MSKKDIILCPVKSLSDLTSFDRIVINNGLSLKGDFVNKESVALTNAMVLEIKEGDIPYAKVALNNHPELYNKKEICITNDFIKNADIYVLKEHKEDTLTDEGYKALFYTTQRKNKKLEKALKKQKAYAKKGRIEPGIAPKKKSEADILNLKFRRVLTKSTIAVPNFEGYLTVTTYQTKSNEITAEITKRYGSDVLASGVAKCSKEDTFNKNVGIEIATARAIVNLYNKIY